MRNTTTSDLYVSPIIAVQVRQRTWQLCTYARVLLHLRWVLTVSSTREWLTWAAINSSVSSIVFSPSFWSLSSSNSCMKSFRRTPFAFRKSIVCFTMPRKNFCTFMGNVRSLNVLNTFGKNTRTILAKARDADELSTAHPICLNSDCEFFSELHSRPNAHVPITSVVNLAVRSRISNSVSPDSMAACQMKCIKL